LSLLPQAWPTGSVKGLRARGGFEVDMEWKEGKLEEAVIRSKLGKTCHLRYGKLTQSIDVPEGQLLRLNGALAPLE
jgi:alpha-L-fucosidase 2